jgi:hypothetical protein
MTMGKSEMKNLSNVLIATAGLYGTNLPPGAVLLYIESLKDFEYKDISKAMSDHIRESKFFPKPAEIIERIRPALNKTDKANTAWLQLLKAKRDYGYYNSVVFDDVVIPQCIRAMGGWLKVSDRDADTWMHKEFIGLYESYSKHCKPAPEAGYVAGFLEANGGRYATGHIGGANDGMEKIEKSNNISLTASVGINRFKEISNILEKNNG